MSSRASAPSLVLVLALGCRGTPAQPGDTQAASESTDPTTSSTDSGTEAAPETDTETEAETDTETETGDPGPFDPTPTDVLAELGCDVTLPEASDALWQAFVDQRETWLYALSEPILACVGNRDTGHPAFHGCIDWHSAVHATWALHAIYRMTGEPSYLAAANAVLDPAGVAGEL